MLPGNRTTGYVWRLAQAPEADVVKLVGEAYNAVPGGRVGSGGEQVFHFRATGVGMARLEFEYLRPWETASPAKRAVWTAIVIGAR